MQNNNNYSNTLDPDLRGSVDFDFFSNEDEREDAKPKTTSNLSAIDEDRTVSESSVENSLKSASIGELGVNKKSNPEDSPLEKLSAQSVSSASPVPSPPPSRASSKSASTIRSGGFPSIPRGDSTRPMSPTPPSSHTSPSPLLMLSPAVLPSDRPNSRAESRQSETSSLARESHRSSRHSKGDSPRSIELRSEQRSPSPVDSSGSSSAASSPRQRSLTPETQRSTSRLSSRSHSRSSSASKASSNSSRSTSRSSSRSLSRSRSLSGSSKSSSTRSSPSNTPRASKEAKGSHVSSEESDVTDVSPLSSKNVSPLGSPPSARKQPTAITPARHHKDQVYFRKDNEEPEGEDQLNVELIMKAILELDRERQGKGTSPSSKRSFSGERQAGSGKNKNYSFTSQRCLQIESENQRLLETLIGQGGRRRPNSAQNRSAPPRPYHSTINRIREQRRIEEENMQILRRLGRVRPTPNMSREQQLRDYRRQSNYGIIVPGAKPQQSLGRKRSKGKDGAVVLPISETSSVQSESRPPSRSLSAGGRASRANSTSSSGRGNGGTTLSRGRKPKAASSRPDWPSGW